MQDPSKGTKQRGAGTRLNRDAYDDDKDDEDSYGGANSAYGEETNQGNALKSRRGFTRSKRDESEAKRPHGREKSKSMNAFIIK